MGAAYNMITLIQTDLLLKIPKPMNTKTLGQGYFKVTNKYLTRVRYKNGKLYRIHVKYLNSHV